VAVMRGGQLQQISSPQDLYEQPANVFVAGFIGSPAMNIFRSRLHKDERGTFMVDIGEQFLKMGASTASRYQQLEKYCDQQILVGLRPEAFTVAPPQADSAISVDVKTVEALGHEMIVHAMATIDKIDTDDQAGEPDGGRQLSADGQHSSILTARVASSRSIQAGHRLNLSVDDSQMYLFSIDGERIP
jgi:multiple sugar transport system ATP-binding protein